MTGAAFTIDAPVTVGIIDEDIPVFTVYPNPAESVLYINLLYSRTSDVELTVLDMKSMNVMTTSYLPEYSSVITLDVACLQSGLYLIQIKTRAETLTARFFKQ